MDKKREKYTVIVGVVTLLILFSNFLPTLDNISLDIGLIVFTVKDYYYFIVIGISSCLYLFMLENILKETRVGNWKLLDYIIILAYFILIILFITPIIIILLYLIELLINSFPLTDKKSTKSITLILGIIVNTSSIIVSFITTLFYVRKKRRLLQVKMEQEEILELEKAQKLFNDGYYSQSILEAFKFFEIHLFRLVTKQGVRIQKHRIKDLIDFALKLDFISDADKKIIDDVRHMRNSAAHIEVEHTKEQAKMAIGLIHELIKRTQSVEED